jgi:broad specificity phosphatase PhoE
LFEQALASDHFDLNGLSSAYRTAHDLAEAHGIRLPSAKGSQNAWSSLVARRFGGDEEAALKHEAARQHFARLIERGNIVPAFRPAKQPDFAWVAKVRQGLPTRTGEGGERMAVAFVEAVEEVRQEHGETVTSDVLYSWWQQRVEKYKAEMFGPAELRPREPRKRLR